MQNFGGTKKSINGKFENGLLREFESLKLDRQLIFYYREYVFVNPNLCLYSRGMSEIFENTWYPMNYVTTVYRDFDPNPGISAEPIVMQIKLHYTAFWVVRNIMRNISLSNVLDSQEPITRHVTGNKD